MRTLPSNMLKDTALLVLPAGVDAWRMRTGAQSITLTRVHVQRSAGMRVMHVDMDLQVHAELWFDCRLSQPSGLDFIDLQRQAESVGAHLGVQYGGIEYRVMLVDELRDAHGRVHHFRLELV